LITVLVAAACADDLATWSYPLDGTLRVNHLQAKGTHNSYHLKPPATSFPPWSYSHAPLGQQLAAQGVRHLELDLYFFDHALLEEPPHFEVRHVPGDFETTCERLATCLSQVASWSATRPAHHPLFILLEPKDPFGAARATALFDTLEREVLHAFPRERILTPARVQGDAATLREAVTTRGWPTLGEARGTVMFALLDGGEHRQAYATRAAPLFFLLDRGDDPDAVVLLVDDPVRQLDRIRAAVAAGLLVRTRADADSVEPLAGDHARLEAALASGAHFISTDYPAPTAGVPYMVSIPGGTPSRCNPVSAPAECSSLAVEDPAFVD
jgi:hypothetical protein